MFPRGRLDSSIQSDPISALVYNVFIAPVYAFIVASASFMLLNAIIFLTSFIIFRLLSSLLSSISAIWPIVSCAMLSGLFALLFSPPRCGLIMPASIFLGSVLAGFASLYWPYGHLTPGWTVPAGALVGVNSIQLVSTETALFSELMRESFVRVSTLKREK